MPQHASNETAAFVVESDSGGADPPESWIEIVFVHINLALRQLRSDQTMLQSTECVWHSLTLLPAESHHQRAQHSLQAAGAMP